MASADRTAGRAEQETLAPGMRIGEFQIAGKIAKGGMGTVYAAIHPVIAKKAAIKVLSRELCRDPEATERFVREARAANRIGHPNIVDVFAFGTLPDGRSYMAMEWLKGRSLAERLTDGPMPVAEAAAVLDQIADALEAVHEQNIIHRDLKPDNIFLVPVRGGRTLVKLLDFGVAKLKEPDASASETLPGMIMGTPGYISPEQARGRDVDVRSDVYALGCVAYEMLTCRLPFELETAAEMISAHLTQEPPPPSAFRSELPPVVDSVVLRLLAKRADDRPTLPELRAVLAQLVEPARASSVLPPELESSAPFVLPAPPRQVARAVTPPAMRQRATLFGAAGLAAVALLAFVGLRRDTERPAAAEAPAVAPPPPVPVPVPVPDSALVLEIDARGRIEVDGTVIADSAAGARVPLAAPGEHRVLVTAPGFLPVARIVVVDAGATLVVPVHLERTAAAAPPPPPAPKPRPPARPAPVRRDKDYILDPFGGK
jgi:serine/threonine-protein kinase